jgi:hypothetical protein
MKFKFLNPQPLFQCHHFVPPNKSQWFIDPKLQQNDNHSCKYGSDQNIKVGQVGQVRQVGQGGQGGQVRQIRQVRHLNKITNSSMPPLCSSK